MAVFDYKGKNNVGKIQDALILDTVNSGAAASEDFTFSGENGWKILDGETLNYNGSTNKYGAFYGESFCYNSAECNVFGQYDAQGNLTQMGLGFWGTGTYKGAPDRLCNTAGDLVSDLLSALLPHYADNYTANAYGRLLTSVEAYAKSQGLSGEDVLVTGHSLGGLATNSLATESAQGKWDGFYNDASYIALASPTQNLANDNVLNVGYENDPVFRALNGHSFTLETLFSHDTPRATATNNIVTFNDFYAGLSKGPDCMSILNLNAWQSHHEMDYDSGMQRIMDAEFYDYTDIDANIIVSNLSQDNRTTTWVQDLNKGIPHTGSTFIVGTDSSDLLKGGAGNDYISGGKGSDIIQDDGGYNMIYGGEGFNRYMTNTSVDDISFSHDASGALYFKFSNGDVTKAENIQSVNAENFTVDKQGQPVMEHENLQVTDKGLEGGERPHDYAVSYYAADENDYSITASDDNSWLFAGDKDSQLHASADMQNIISGLGNDDIYLGGKDDTLMFYGDFGHDTLYDLDKSDSLIFMGNKAIGSNDSYLNHMTEEGDNTVLDFGDNSVTLVGVNTDMLSDMNIVVA